MFKRYFLPLQKYLIIPVITWVVFTHFAHAEWLGENILGNMLTDAAAWISTMMLNICSIFLMITGALLNTSIVMTMHIKDFVDNTPGVYLVWQTIRDVSGMFIIFMLLYASFKIIIGFDTVGGVGNLIKNIVIAGILINFSFFITSLLIDASNIVSLALYQGIMGNDTSQTVAANSTSSNCQSSTGSGNDTCKIAESMIKNPATSTAGMAAIFLNILKPQSIYKQGTASPNTSSVSKAMQILIQGLVGCALMLIASFSFLFASIAFIVRLITLILLLGFSPIWFAAWVVPKLDDQAKKFTDLLKSNLIFMPVYLLLLYASLRFINSSKMFTSPGSNSPAIPGLELLPLNYMTLAINDFFAIFLLNLPLVAALMLGGATTEMANKWTNSVKGWSKKQVQGAGSMLARNTAGRAAHIANNSGLIKNLSASSPLVGNFVSKRLDKVANYGFGTKKGGFKDVTEQRQKDYEKQYENLGKASAAEKARYNNDDDKRDENGKTELERYLSARQDKHLENISKPTIMSRLVKKATKTAGAVSNTLSGGKLDPETIDAISENVSASFNASESAAVENIKKKKEDEANKADKKRAEKEKEIFINSHSVEKNAHGKELEVFNADIEKLDADMKILAEKETELAKVVESELPMKNLHNPGSTTTNEASLAATKTALEAIKAKKIELERQKSEAKAKFTEKVTAYNEAIDKIDKRISKGKAVEEKESQNKTIKEMERIVKENSSKSDGGGSTPKPSAPKP